jgi:hypothetical protein
MQARKLRHLTELASAVPADATTHDFATASQALAKPPELTWRDHAIMLLHIAANEAWLHAHLAPIDDGPLHDDDDRESSQQQADLNPSSIGPA